MALVLRCEEERRFLAKTGQSVFAQPSSDLRYTREGDNDPNQPCAPTSRGKLIPTVVAIFLSVLTNFIILHAAIEYDKEGGGDGGGGEGGGGEGGGKGRGEGGGGEGSGGEGGGEGGGGEGGGDGGGGDGGGEGGGR